MASNSQCDPCSRLDKSSPADQWCVDCEDALCRDCTTAHRGSKASLKHHLIDLNVANALPSETLTCQKCTEHPEFYREFFCTQHDVLCCRHCMSDEHRSCDKVMPLELASKEVKASLLFHDTYEGMKQVVSTYKDISQTCQENIDKIKGQEKSIGSTIATFKATLIKTLDDMEKQTISELENVQKLSVSHIESNWCVAEKSVTFMEKSLHQLEFLEKNGSNRHVFLLLHELQPTLLKEQSRLEEFASKLLDLNLVYTQPKDIFHQQKELGSVCIHNNPSPIGYRPSKNMEAQEISVVRKDLKSLIIQNSFEVDESAFGMYFNKSGNLVVTGGSSLHMYSIDGTYINNISLGKSSYKAYDTAYSRELDSVAVSLKHDGLLILNFTVQSRNKFAHRRIRGTFMGITWVREHIYAGGTGNLEVIDTGGNVLRNIRLGHRNLNFLYYKNYRIYVSEYGTNNVFCIKEDGTKIFTFSNPDLLGPDGITTDQQGNIYVVGRKTNNIHRLTSDGKNSKVILQAEDGINDPITLCFDGDYNRLFISNEGGKTIYEYSCKY